MQNSHALSQKIYFCNLDLKSQAFYFSRLKSQDYWIQVVLLDVVLGSLVRFELDLKVFLFVLFI